VKLICNTNLDATGSLVISHENNNLATIPTLFLEDVLPIEIVFLGEGGGLAPFVGQANNEIKVAIGNLSTSEILTQATLDEDGKAILDLGTNSMALEMYDFQQKTFTFEIQISYANQKTETLCQVPCTIQNQLIGTLVIPNFPLSVFAQAFELPNRPTAVTAQNMDARTIFLPTDVGRQFIALRTKTPRGLIEGEIYTINSINNIGDTANFDVISGLGAVNYVHRGLFFEFV
jgi:hypothetical protein